MKEDEIPEVLNGKTEDTLPVHYYGGSREGLDLTPIASIDPNKMIERAEAMAQVWERVRRAAITLTRKRDWVDFGGTPRPTDAAASIIAATFGLQITAPVMDVEEGKDEAGPWYSYTFTANVIVPGTGAVIPVKGACSSRDKFFGRKDGKKRAIEDITRTNVKMKAMTNLRVNAVIAGCGLRGATWEDLAAFGIRPDNAAASVKFDGKKAAPAKKEESGEKGEDDNEPIGAIIAEVEYICEGARTEIDGASEQIDALFLDKEGTKVLGPDDFRRWKSDKARNWLRWKRHELREMFPRVASDYRAPQGGTE